jgi:Na+/proline symporter
MPPGVVGLLIAAIFAAGMSNLSGALNSLASSSIIDFQKIRGMAAASPGQLLKLSRWMTFGWGLVLMLLGTIKWGGVLVSGLTIASIVFQSLLGLFLLGVLNKGATANGALIGMFVGLAAMILIWWKTPLAWSWYVLVGSTITFVVGSLASALRPSANAPAAA